ncbi:sugar kinase [Salinifilum ghardaiensis]
MTEVLTFGEVMAMFVARDGGDLSEVDHFDARLAGAEMNVAVGLSRLGHRVRYLGVVGEDPFGRRARARLRDEGVDVSALSTDPAAPTGFQLKERVSGRDPEVVYFRRGSAGSRLRWSAAAEDAVRRTRHLHLTGIAPALGERTREFAFRAAEVARSSGATVSFDPNLRPALWTDGAEMSAVLNDLAARADWVLPGAGEGRILAGTDDPGGIAAFYRSRGASHVVVKLGGDGAAVHGPAGVVRQPAFPVDVVDTVGAGDGFAAGWISARLDGADDADALRRACVVGALATTSEGDMDGLPARRTLDELAAAERG